MKYTLIEKTNGPLNVDCLVIAVDAEQKLILAGCTLPNSDKTHLQNIVATGDLAKNLGSTLLTHTQLDTKRVLLVRSDKPTLSAAAYNQLLNNAYTTLHKTKTRKALSFLQHITVNALDTEQKLTKNIIACDQTAYSYAHKPKKTKPNLTQVNFACKKIDSKQKAGVKVGIASSLGITLAKELGNTPPNKCTPTFMANKAKALGKAYAKLTTTVLNETQMAKLGMGALLGVSQGSQEPAKFIVMQYQGAAKSTKPLVLVGKGVTFDSGGTSLKPPSAMMEMKYDMLGAASVFGTLKAICELNLNKNVIGITPCSENMPNGNALKPGDVVKSLSGIEIEVLNTDAEGRLLLCDALCYAKKFKPAAVIDLATLTGAALAAFGHHAQPVMGNQQTLVDGILKTFNTLGEHTWQMPLLEEYNRELKSNVADVANIATVHARLGQAIHAGCFLSRFTEEYDWAHLDIAGTSFNGRALATGRPIAALIQFVMHYKG